MSEPFFLFTSLFDLREAFLLTLLLIGSHRFTFQQANLLSFSLPDLIFHQKLDRLHR
jgi:hypothetical protein